jgi:hypothetical protein
MDKKAVYVVGDSISMHYGPYLKKYLQNCFVYDRKREEGQPETNLDKPMGRGETVRWCWIFCSSRRAK